MPYIEDSEFDVEHHDIRDEFAGVPPLIFPINVVSSLKAEANLKPSEKRGLIISFWVFGCVVLGWFLMSWLRNVTTHYILLMCAVEILLNATVGVYLLRFLMDESTLQSELDEKADTFAQYFKIYRELTGPDNLLPFDALEMDDGSLAVYIQCRFGANTNNKSNNTYYTNKAITAILNKNNINHKIYYTNEDFKSSQEAVYLRESLVDCKDPVLFKNYREILQNYLNIANDDSNTICTTYMLLFQTRIQREEAPLIINSVMNEFNKTETVYREVKILDYQDIVEFLRQYYCLDVLDMGLVRASSVINKNLGSVSVEILKVYGKSGKIYASSSFKQLREDQIKSADIPKYT